MHIVYIDDSKDAELCCFSALLIPAEQWRNSLEVLLEARRAMRDTDGIYITKEMHATDWVGGRGNISKNVVPKGARARLFRFYLERIAGLPGLAIINACGPIKKEYDLFQRLMNRVERNMKSNDSRCVILCDEGKSYDFLLRKMRRFNPIPSQMGQWQDGSASQNIVVERIIEDIIYRNSERNFFIQAADFCAFSLLRFERPTEKAIKYEIHDAFMILESVLVKQAFAKDPKGLGIIRA
jgi:hypothetical protein